MGLRTNGLTLLASKAQALAQAGRLEEATTALAQAQREFAAYQERFAEPVLLLAEAVLAHARGDDASHTVKILSSAADAATAQGGLGVARRVRATAERLGHRI